jgi:glycosyltransferase involved in cell wall biosynthesis
MDISDPLNPLVSVIIPAYNSGKFIEATLNSALAQTYQNVEIMVVDDGSQDRTAEIVSQIASKEKRIVLLCQKNQGVAAARNLAIRHSKGVFIAPLDSDDIWYPLKLERQVECMLSSDSQVGIVSAGYVFIDEDGDLINGWGENLVNGRISEQLIYFNPISASLPLIRRTVLEKVGFYNQDLREQNAQGLEDWELALRIGARYEFRTIPEILMGFRQLSSSMSQDTTQMTKAYRVIMSIAKDLYPEAPSELYRLSESNMYRYNAIKSELAGAHSKALFWLAKAIQIDSVLLSRPEICKMLLRQSMYLLGQPISSLFFTHQSWMQFRKKFRKSKPSLKAIEEIIRQDSEMSINSYSLRSQQTHESKSPQR